MYSRSRHAFNLVILARNRVKWRYTKQYLFFENNRPLCLSIQPLRSQQKQISHIKNLLDTFELSLDRDFDVINSNEEKPLSSSPEIVINNLYQRLIKNLRVPAKRIVIELLEPIERHNGELIDALRRTPENVSIIIRMCGRPLPDMSFKMRMLLLNRLWQGFIKNGLHINIDAFNNRLLVHIENECAFDVIEMMNELRNIHKLEPNSTTYSHLIEECARTGKISELENIMSEAKIMEENLDAAIYGSQIKAYAICGRYDEANLLYQKAIGIFGENYHSSLLSSMLCGIATRNDLQEMRKLLDIFPSKMDKYSKDGELFYDLHFTVTFEVLRHIAKATTSDYSECEEFSKMLLRKTNKTSRFFKYAFCEIIRYIIEGNYRFAFLILEICKPDHTSRGTQFNYQNSAFVAELMNTLANRLILNAESINKIQEIVERMDKIFTNECRFCDFIGFSILTSHKMRIEQKFSYIQELIDKLDERRERMHIILPILNSTSDLQQKLNTIRNFASIGYADISQLEIEFILKLLLNPMLKSYGKKENQYEKLDHLFNDLVGLNLSVRSVLQVLNRLYEALISRNLTVYPMCLDVELDEVILARWLEMKRKCNENERASQDFHQELFNLKKLIDETNIEEVMKFLEKHASLICANSNLDSDKIVDSLFELFSKHGNWGHLSRAVEILSVNCKQSHSFLKNYHLLLILREHIGEFRNLISTINYCKELRILFPNTTFSRENFYATNSISCSLFEKCFRTVKLSRSSMLDSLNLLKTLVDLNFVELHREECISDLFLAICLGRLGWNEAVSVWTRFQSLFSSINGIMRLLQTAYAKKEFALVDFVLTKAKNFSSPSRINSIHGSVLLKINRLEDATNVFKETSIDPYDALCALRLIRALDYQKPDDTFIFNFIRLCLEHTSLCADKEICESFHDEWIDICEKLQLGKTAIDIYYLFKKFGGSFKCERLEKIRNLSKKHYQLSSEWIYLPSGLLNVEKAEHDDFEMKYNSLLEDLELMRHVSQRIDQIAYNQSLNSSDN